MDEHGPDDLAPANSADRATEPGDAWNPQEGAREAFQEPPKRETLDSQRRRRPNRAFQQMAARLEDTADRLDQLVDAQLGSGLAPARASDAVQAASEAIQDVAAYLRASDLRSIRDDLAEQVRAKPLQTTLVALGVGWLAGKILR
ncbi:MAG: hypothetical protein GEU90_08300 [Gemmatimonas sp.]|nr:hypothetical protein [Gemmatimonas sp.]